MPNFSAMDFGSGSLQFYHCHEFKTIKGPIPDFLFFLLVVEWNLVALQPNVHLFIKPFYRSWTHRLVAVYRDSIATWTLWNVLKHLENLEVINALGKLEIKFSCSLCHCLFKKKGIGPLKWSESSCPGTQQQYTNSYEQHHCCALFTLFHDWLM